jgi:hypothetical protein
MTKSADTQVVLAAPGRSPDIPEADDAYGWLVGSWDLDVLHYWTDVRGRGLKAEAHFGWILEGHAMQDMWRIAPEARTETTRMLGTTLRVWDPSVRAWRVTWINPLTGQKTELIGRWSGKDVVQVGTHADGTPVRWSFTDITKDSFHWIGEALDPDGRTWNVQGEFRARRVR